MCGCTLFTTLTQSRPKHLRRKNVIDIFPVRVSVTHCPVGVLVVLLCLSYTDGNDVKWCKSTLTLINTSRAFCHATICSMERARSSPRSISICFGAAEMFNLLESFPFQKTRNHLLCECTCGLGVGLGLVRHCTWIGVRAWVISHLLVLAWVRGVRT